MHTFTESPIEEVMVNGRLCWRFADGTTHPVIRGGAVDDDDADADGDDGDEHDEEDPDDDDADGDDDQGEDDDDAEDGDDGDEDEDDTDAWVELVSEAVVAKVGSEIDRRINKALRKVRRDDEDDDDRDRGRRRSRRSEPAFSVREARLAGMELIRDEMPRMTTAEREAARTMLTAQIEASKGSGDDEETVGERAAQTVLSTMQALRGPKKRPVKKAPPQRKKTSSGRTRDVGSKMKAGAARAAAFNTKES